MKTPLYFDSASTTRCHESAAQLILKYAVEDYGNPSSNHHYGQKSARAIRDARAFFAKTFRVEPDQVIFTGSGSESDNLAIYGVTSPLLLSKKSQPIRTLISSLEHPAVRKTAESLKDYGVEVAQIPSLPDGQIREQDYLQLLTPQTRVVSIQQVNNITGVAFPVEELAKKAKAQVPQVVFHTDAVQAFGKVPHPQFPTAVDLVSISGHKFGGPKGIGALIVLNRKLLKEGIRPLIWGGNQENGMRSGTQNAGLIAAFHFAAEQALQQRSQNYQKISQLNRLFRDRLQEKRLLQDHTIVWNSPENAIPHIMSLSVPGYPAGPLSKLLEERGCIVSVGSACSSRKPEPDPVLSALGLSMEIQTSTIRVSLSPDLDSLAIETLVEALHDSIQTMEKLLGRSASSKKSPQRKSSV